jgi:Asp-tRNA(Asn)/Glu-tRNA(Gln) amidotransferase A subunit family amidase
VSRAPSLPTDRIVDRRAFLRRAGALTAAASTGALGSTLVPAAAAASGFPSRALRIPDVADPQMANPAFLTVAEAAAAIRRRDLSAVELVEACLDRVRRLDGVYMAFNTVLEDRALAGARAADRASARGVSGGALHGIPLAIKDNYYTAGVRTTANSHIFADFVPDYDAEAWARLAARGAILLGKTQMGPLATSRATTPDGQATTLNAWAPGDSSVSPGGSSSGSATSVASRMALSSTGTQTGGSITNPSEAQGLTGLKPTMGRVSLRGIIPLTYTRDHPGPLARDAMDAAIMLSIMAGPDRADPRTLGQPRLPDLVTAATPVQRAGRPRLRWPTRIGVIEGYLAGPAPLELISPDAPTAERDLWERRQALEARGNAQAAARRAMLDTFRELGAEVVAVDLPRDWDVLTSDSFNNVRLPERSEPFLEVLRDDVRKFGVSLSPWINGLLLPGTEYLRGQRAKLLLLRRILDDLFAQCDVVVQTSPIPFDIVGLPLIAFPVGFHGVGDSALPMGAVFGGQPWAEDRLLSLVGAYQAATDWHRRRPADPTRNDRGEVVPAPPVGERGRVDVWEVDAFGQ